MFQYASLFGMANKHQCGIVLNKFDIELYKCFDLKTRLYSFYNSEFECPNGLDGSIAADGHSIMVETEEQNARLLSTRFDSDFFETNHDGKSLLGFFQNSNYFMHCEEELRKEFTFRPKYDRVAEMYVSENFDEIIAIHIRRTDYINSHVLNNLHINYYKEALEHFDDSIPVLIFSDDPEWCKKIDIFGSDRFRFMESSNTFLDLAIMSKCDYHIIANSSYSWWGAWLARSKKTICPKQWFLPYCDYLDSDGLRIKEWISI
jgi:hypothetical protein